MKKVVILRGVSGSGKSRYACEAVAGIDPARICSADQYFEHGGRYYFDPMKLPEAHNFCFGRFLEALTDGYPLIVVDNTNSHHWEYENYEKAAKLAGYKAEIVEVQASTVDEIRLCFDRNTHGVPRDIIARMAVDFEPDERAKIIPVIK
jgi:hypothetical protein